MKYVIGLDLGTTNCKAIVLTEGGKILRTSSSSYSFYYPRPGWVEQNPDEVWIGVQTALQSLNVKSIPGDLLNICISGAMHSVIPVDERNQALAPAMTWADQRASKQAEMMKKSVDSPSLYRRSGCPLNYIYHAPKIRWWFDEVPQISARTSKYVAIKDYIIFKLTGRWITDRGLGSTTGLLDIHNGKWIPELLDLANINENYLPELVWASDEVGGVTHGAAKATHIPEKTIVIAGTHDGGLANIGAGANSFDQTVITVGTSGAVRRFVEKPIYDSLQRTWCYLMQKDIWLVGGAINNGGVVVDWMNKIMYNIEGVNGYAQLMEEARLVPPGSDGLLILPYFSGERSPHWNPNLRASFLGVDIHHNRSHFARAILEGVSFCIKDVYLALISSLHDFPNDTDTIFLTGGITKSPVWAQILSDVLGTNLRSVDIADASAVGAAFLGLQAAGIIPINEQPMNNYFGNIYRPNLENHSLYNNIFQIFVNKFSSTT